MNLVLEGCRQEEVLARHLANRSCNGDRHSAIAGQILNASNTEQVARSCKVPGTRRGRIGNACKSRRCPGDRHSAIAGQILNASNTEQVARCQAPVRGALAMHANPAVALGTDTR
ncbi:MAG: hypothetical protein ACKN9S_12415, partial [Pirellula sp.]